MKVNHLGSDVNGNSLRILRHLQSERAIERQHGVRVLHRQSDMIKASNVSRLLQPGNSSNCNHPADKFSTGYALSRFHAHLTVAASCCPAGVRRPYYSPHTNKSRCDPWPFRALTFVLSNTAP